jgi:hypothetical protein
MSKVFSGITIFAISLRNAGQLECSRRRDDG